MATNIFLRYQIFFKIMSNGYGNFDGPWPMATVFFLYRSHCLFTVFKIILEGELFHNSDSDSDDSVNQQMLFEV